MEVAGGISNERWGKVRDSIYLNIMTHCFVFLPRQLLDSQPIFYASLHRMFKSLWTEKPLLPYNIKWERFQWGLQ